MLNPTAIRFALSATSVVGLATSWRYGPPVLHLYERHRTIFDLVVSAVGVVGVAAALIDHFRKRRTASFVSEEPNVQAIVHLMNKATRNLEMWLDAFDMFSYWKPEEAQTLLWAIYCAVGRGLNVVINVGGEHEFSLATVYGGRPYEELIAEKEFRAKLEIYVRHLKDRENLPGVLTAELGAERARACHDAIMSDAFLKPRERGRLGPVLRDIQRAVQAANRRVLTTSVPITVNRLSGAPSYILWTADDRSVALYHFARSPRARGQLFRSRDPNAIHAMIETMELEAKSVGPATALAT